MSADWYFMKSGWFGSSRRIGPISEVDLISRIDHGDISPETLMQSETKTKGKWIKMREVGPAMRRWKDLHPKQS